MKIRIVNEIPQWIISSDIAAFNSKTKTIWIKRGLGIRFIPVLFHELQHFMIYKFLNDNEKLHNKIDKINKL